MARFVAATNRDLQQMVNEGSFRSDLFYRLNVITLQMPALRSRGEDVILLARFFANQTERRYGLPHKAFSHDALMSMRSYTWPGNVRELRHQISRAVLLCRDQQITAHDLALPVDISMSQSISSTSGTVVSQHELVSQQVTLDAAERMMIENALTQSNFNVSEAARRLGITRMAMRYRMEKHGIKS